MIVAIRSALTLTATAIATVRAYAEAPGHQYRPLLDDTPPGYNPQQVLQVGGLRAVYSITQIEALTFRMLSVSGGPGWREPDGYPEVFATFDLAKAFGFVVGEPEAPAPADGTGIYLDEDEGTAVFHERWERQ